MGQSPLRWALGVAAAVTLAAAYHGDRIAGIFSGDAPNLATVRAPNPPPVPAAARPAGRPTLTVAADYRGHYVVHPSIDNYRIRMLVDTGASFVALTAADARALGIKLSSSDYKIALNTANGVVRGARVNLREVRLGEILVRNVEAVVLPAGALSMSLLGTSFLGKLQGYEVQTGRMVLRG
jgi:aspartyl protease family protein